VTAAAGYLQGVNWPEVIAGVLFIVWPATYRHQIGKVHNKMVARGADTTRFDERMNHRYFRVALWVVPVVGVGFVIAGLTTG
jgi:hypothetical protein